MGLTGTCTYLMCYTPTEPACKSPPESRLFFCCTEGTLGLPMDEALRTPSTRGVLQLADYTSELAMGLAEA